ncbi:MAG: flagellar biosynthesis anti-sigma factor FlgM, partial [Deltaproteobacteria bacterium]|nr:flagellar biosynthesis anti-sigma factor FlgM [Deltaproteobacteria bacterium]
AEKVAQIKAEVEAGRYQRPAADIAEKMITGSLQESLYQ